MNHVINRSLLDLRRLTINLVTYPEGHSVMRHNDPSREWQLLQA